MDIIYMQSFVVHAPCWVGYGRLCDVCVCVMMCFVYAYGGWLSVCGKCECFYISLCNVSSMFVFGSMNV